LRNNTPRTNHRHAHTHTHIPKTKPGRLQVVAVHGLNERRGAAPVFTAAALGAKHEHHLNLKLPNGGLRRLVLPVELPGLPRSGSRVLVTTQPMDACGGSSAGAGSSGGNDALCVKSMMAHEGAGREGAGALCCVIYIVLVSFMPLCPPSLCYHLAFATNARARIAAAARDVYTQGQPRGALHVKMLVMQLDVCGRGIATHDWAVRGRKGGRAGRRRKLAFVLRRTHTLIRSPLLLSTQPPPQTTPKQTTCQPPPIGAAPGHLGRQEPDRQPVRRPHGRGHV
jgi:hypothetical protein